MVKPVGIRIEDLLNTSSASPIEARVTENIKTYSKCFPDYCANKKQKEANCYCYPDNCLTKIEEEGVKASKSNENDKNNIIIVYNRPTSDFSSKKLNLGDLSEEYIN